MCKNWREKGSCKYGDKCLFAHGDQELTKRSSAPPVEEKPKPTPTPEQAETAKENQQDKQKELDSNLTESVEEPSFKSEAKNLEKDDSFETPKRA